MISNKIAVLTSRESWFIPYAKTFIRILIDNHYEPTLFLKYKDIGEDYAVVFILSYFEIVPKDLLCQHKYNLVVHESALPKGRGWSPLFWQILEEKNKIPIVLFDATEKVDEGVIYIKDYINLIGHELHDEIREKQARKAMELCLRFLDKRQTFRPRKQKGTPTYYRKRTPNDSELDITKSITEQFNLLRIVNNVHYPAFFEYKGHKYIIKIFKA